MPDGGCDLVSAYSVFTHIDLFEEGWLLELLRVTRPGGLLLLTFLGDRLWQSLVPGHHVYESALQNSLSTSDVEVTPELFSRPMPQGRVVFRQRDESVSTALVFHREDYLRSRWGLLAEICEIIPGGHYYQDIIVLRKR